MISSVPYVPPDTMKKVAATSGQSVSLAALFLGVGMAREGSWAGSDIELNFYSRPPKGISLSRYGKARSHSQNTRDVTACKEKMYRSENFFRLTTHTFVLPESLSFESLVFCLPFASLSPCLYGNPSF